MSDGIHLGDHLADRINFRVKHGTPRLFQCGEQCEVAVEVFAGHTTVAVQHRLQAAVQTVDGVKRPGKWSKQLPIVNLDKGEILSCKSAFGKKIYLEFRIVAGADGYIIERSDKKDGEFVKVGTTQGQTSVEFCDKVPSAFKSYRYRVKAYKIVNETEYISVPSAEISVKSK